MFKNIELREEILDEVTGGAGNNQSLTVIVVSNTRTVNGNSQPFNQGGSVRITMINGVLTIM